MTTIVGLVNTPSTSHNWFVCVVRIFKADNAFHNLRYLRYLGSPSGQNQACGTQLVIDFVVALACVFLPSPSLRMVAF